VVLAVLVGREDLEAQGHLEVLGVPDFLGDQEDLEVLDFLGVLGDPEDPLAQGILAAQVGLAAPVFPVDPVDPEALSGLAGRVGLSGQ
jgi:hypothetical protein